MRNGWWLQQRRRVVGLARQSPERAGHSHRVVPPLQETPVICAQVPLTAEARCGAGDQHSGGLTVYYRSLNLP